MASRRLDSDDAGEHLTFRCVPEGLLKIAQAFKPGISSKRSSSPEGTAGSARICSLLYKN